MSAKPAKRRLDQRLFDEGLADSLRLAGALVMEGNVLVNDEPAKSAGQQVRDDAVIRLRRISGGWVSRGAHKLLTAIDRFHLNLTGRVCLDIGASTGGFTQVMLKNGAARVYAVDVGYSLLDWRLRNDDRVVVMERQNARFLTPDMFSPPPQFLSSDASFISLRALLAPMAQVSAPEAESVVLVKPQFEARPDDVCEGGVVRSKEIHKELLKELAGFIAQETPWRLTEATWSGIKGPKGNIEFLFHLKKQAQTAEIDFAELTEQAHHALNEP